jgi:phosphoglycolate phosphatase-like HAD superfamily hydrolase
VSSTLLIGDSHVDLETARAAGTHVCLARYGFGFSSIQTDTLTASDRTIAAASELVAL